MGDLFTNDRVSLMRTDDLFTNDRVSLMRTGDLFTNDRVSFIRMVTRKFDQLVS